MLAELATCNAAYQITKIAISNGSELAKCGKVISDLTLTKLPFRKRRLNLGVTNHVYNEFHGVDATEEKMRP